MVMNRGIARFPISSVLLALTLALSGCAGSAKRHAGGAGRVVGSDAQLSLDDADPVAAFDAVRETLIDYRFALERVDAWRGVITTRPKRTAGLASPWDREQSGLDQEWEDLLNEQRRVVRVEFTRDEATSSFTALTVRVELVRSHRPGWRLESESVRLSTHARTRDDEGRLEPVSFDEVIGLDTRFADRLLSDIGSRISSAAASP